MNFNDFELKLLLQHFRKKGNSQSHFKCLKNIKLYLEDVA